MNYEIMYKNIFWKTFVPNGCACFILFLNKEKNKIWHMLVLWRRCDCDISSFESTYFTLKKFLEEFLKTKDFLLQTIR